MMEGRITRRELLKYGAVGIGGLLLPVAAGRGGLLNGGTFGLRPSGASADSIYIEAFPVSPLILNPFKDPLPIPRALAPVPKSVFGAWSRPLGPGIGQQDSEGGRHQIWTSQLNLPDPIVYQIKIQVNAHRFTSSKVLPIDRNGKPAASWDERRKGYAAGTKRDLPASTIYGFNGTFPGPRINAEYGRPVLVRFENHLGENPLNLDRQDFGIPQWGFLTHLHNGHTAAESDGNPFQKNPGYHPRAVGR